MDFVRKKIRKRTGFFVNLVGNCLLKFGFVCGEVMRIVWDFIARFVRP